nr:immunoglobulin heavy chain junction region [Mus musculus]MBK4188562.1 immunoglobulin heavy chain junction region [Mus musculus]MBK4188563.1 immunoglobulin heavy chain junction region [Mus musculus]MBK4188567.1 immunoglobulin heavy chain junction region [Mus musculus]MBK4188568.1 immunoglobulin heavy chain junction region [Mus musculus]
CARGGIDWYFDVW